LRKLYIFILLSIAFLYGCKRYPDGPLISFRSVEGRLEGNWQIAGFTSNGVDSLQYCIDSCGNSMNINMQQANGSYNFLTFSRGFEADWTFSDNKRIMNVSFFPDSVYTASFSGVGFVPIKEGCNIQWKIVKLELKELEITTTSNGCNYVMSFMKEWMT
jgi:hypothetical protein